MSETGAVYAVNAIPVEATTLVRDWFGAPFAQLHPLLQRLHSQRESRLEGTVAMRFGRGLAGVLGRRLARRLGMPGIAGGYRMEVDVGHDATQILWQRRFGDGHALLSQFRPVGRYPDGHWVEGTGPIEFTMQVDINDGGGWDWRWTGARVRGVRVPLWLLPRPTAYKRVVDGRYSFHVGFRAPVLGELFAYEGRLDPVDGSGAQAATPIPR